MKITVVTTIAQHYKNPSFHIRNLQWALSEYDYKIVIQTFKKHKLNFKDKRIRVINVDKDPNEFYCFWNYVDLILEKELKNTDFFLFTEQDIFFIEKPKIKKEDSIILNLSSDYLSVYDHKMNFLYPRIWEGATFLNVKIIENAIENKIKFGECCESFKEKIYLKCKNKYTTNSALKFDFKSVKEVTENCLLDTLLEFSFYCYLKNFKYKLENNKGYEYSDYVVHLRGIDMMCHDNPKIYEDVNEIFNLKKTNDVWRRLSGGCALLLFVSGVYKRSKALKNVLSEDFKDSDKLNLIKTKLLLKKSKEWLSAKEIENLKWAEHVLENKIIYI